MSLNKIQIISRVIELLNKGPITSIADTFSQTVENTYDYLIVSELAKPGWRFAVKIQELSKLVDTPVIDNWDYIYELPSDYLSLVRLHPNTINYQIYSNKTLYSNETSLKAEYRFKPNEIDFPGYFQDYIIKLVASHAALTNATSETLSAKLAQMAQMALNSAMAADAQSHPSFEIQDSPLTSVR